MDKSQQTKIMDRFKNSIWKKRILWGLGILILAALTTSMIFSPVYIEEREDHEIERQLGWELINSQNSDMVKDFVTSIAFDQDGRAWIGTNDGVSVFDGDSWVSYTTENSALELTDASVGTIEVDPEGRVWIGLSRGGGTTGGLIIVDGENWEAYPSGIPPYRGSVFAIAFNDNNQAWIGTDSGIHIFNGISWKSINHGDYGSALIDDAIRAIEIDESGGVWIGTMEGLSFYNGETWRSYTVVNSDIPENFINCIEVDQRGNTWIGWRGGASVFDGKSWTNYHWSHSYPGIEREYADNVNEIVTDSLGRILFISESALRIFDGEIWLEYNSGNSGYLQTSVYDVAIDPQGNIWIASASGVVLAHVEGSGLPQDTAQESSQKEFSPANYLNWLYLLLPIIVLSLIWFAILLDDIVLINASVFTGLFLINDAVKNSYYGVFLLFPTLPLLPWIGGLIGSVIRKIKKKTGYQSTTIGLIVGTVIGVLLFILGSLMAFYS